LLFCLFLPPSVCSAGNQPVPDWDASGGQHFQPILHTRACDACHPGSWSNICWLTSQCGASNSCHTAEDGSLWQAWGKWHFLFLLQVHHHHSLGIMPAQRRMVLTQHRQQTRLAYRQGCHWNHSRRGIIFSTCWTWVDGLNRLRKFICPHLNIYYAFLLFHF
jgi:hypothetical protein